ncbi:MAG: MBL fold metallo-hydrolase, partial [Armatimonadetes bacterium]|nr:MBL fold metallo-hydrolase [Armatimonadota bacterium]
MVLPQALGKKVFAIQHVFLSHGHEDHIAGISNLVNIRNLTSGERDKPLNIYYPMHDPWINALIEYVEKKQSGLLRYPLYVQPLEPGAEVEIEVAKRPTKVVAFEMRHARGQLCLGYEIQEERRLMDGSSDQGVCRYHPTFFYTGDGYEPVYSPYGRIDIAIHEATFLARDAGLASAIVSHRHATIEKAVDWGASQDVKILILCHISDRYSL